MTGTIIALVAISSGMIGFVLGQASRNREVERLQKAGYWHGFAEGAKHMMEFCTRLKLP